MHQPELGEHVGGFVQRSDHTTCVLGNHLKTMVRNPQVRSHQHCWEARGWLTTGCCGRTRLPDSSGRRESTKYRGLGAAFPQQQPQGCDYCDGKHDWKGSPLRESWTWKLGQSSEEQDREAASGVWPHLYIQPKSRMAGGDAEGNKSQPLPTFCT